MTLVTVSIHSWLSFPGTFRFGQEGNTQAPISIEEADGFQEGNRKLSSLFTNAVI
jgi:hypothetical protein